MVSNAQQETDDIRVCGQYRLGGADESGGEDAEETEHRGAAAA